jgi:hypothetical protein
MFRPGDISHAKGSWAVTETPGTSDCHSKLRVAHFDASNPRAPWTITTQPRLD